MTTRRKIIRFISYVIIILILVFFIYTIYNYIVLREELTAEIQTYGSIGIFAASFFIDTLGGPLGPEVPVIGGLLTGIKWETVVIMTALGSLIASVLVYLIGRTAGKLAILNFTTEKNYTKWKNIFRKYQKLTLVLAALTPVPYVTICLISGIFHTRFWEFVVFAFGARVLRIIGVVYLVSLIKGGF